MLMRFVAEDGFETWLDLTAVEAAEPYRYLAPLRYIRPQFLEETPSAAWKAYQRSRRLFIRCEGPDGKPYFSEEMAGRWPDNPSRKPAKARHKAHKTR